ncbi:unnamed protein product [Coffea canephora]|uniref:Serine-threonine/tyrosine-protein kinase catalytic domain-containing protein n=1 Tax=Coffea canephora TaxID=49390 RepID=A0A068UQQ4_COFCA|nr:unnamed protein product [Coffea canephora]
MATEFNSFAFSIPCFRLLCLANAISFQITRFSPDLSTILYRRDAIASVGAIEFNNVDCLYRVGRTIYSQPVPIWDSHSGKTSGRKAKEIGLIVGLTAAGAILLAGGVIAIVVLRRKIQSAKGNPEMAASLTSGVKITSSLRHRNLVQLIGWCHDQNEFLLVYEFMPNGSLDTRLFGRKNLLSWEREIQNRNWVGICFAVSS